MKTNTLNLNPSFLTQGLRPLLAGPLAVLFFGLLLSTSGCILVGSDGGGGGAGDGSLTINYTFEQAFCEVAGVDRLVVRVDGVDVDDGTLKDEQCGAFPQGMTLHNLSAGTYRIYIEGYTAGTLRFQSAAPTEQTVGAGQVTQVSIDVPSVFGDLNVYWQSFGGETSCTTAGVDQVVASLFDAQDQLLKSDPFACSAGGANWPAVAPGDYTVQLDAYALNGDLLFQGTQAIQVVRGRSDSFTVDLDATTGSLLLYWTFAGSGTCGQVRDLHVLMIDESGQSYDDATYACSLTGVEYPTAPAGRFSVSFQALDASGRILFQGGSQSVDVVAGTSNQYVIDLN